MLKKQEDDEKKKKVLQEIKNREEHDKLLKGTSGKGHRQTYKSFCKHCFTEYRIEMPKCTHCQHDT
jgi:hypothetical protein